MKKIFITLSFLFIFLFICNVTSNAHVSENLKYTTTTNMKYDDGEVDVYLEDFKDKSFDTQQEIIDYVYDVGYDRQKQYDIFSYKLTSSEIVLFINYFYYIKQLVFAQAKARNMTQELFGTTSDGTPANAFCHAYWTMLISDFAGADVAYEFVLAHEDYDSNPKLEKRMDLYNDKVAYEYCKEHGNTNSWESTESAMSLYNNASLKYIIRNYEYLSKIVTNTKLNKVTYVYETGDFLAYTTTDYPLDVPSYTIEVIGNGPSIISEV